MKTTKESRPEAVSIRLDFTLCHREGQESPATEIARVLHALALGFAEGLPNSWNEIHDSRGEPIGEFHFDVKPAEARG